MEPKPQFVWFILNSPRIKVTGLVPLVKVDEVEKRWSFSMWNIIWQSEKQTRKRDINREVGWTQTWAGAKRPDEVGELWRKWTLCVYNRYLDSNQLCSLQMDRDFREYRHLITRRDSTHVNYGTLGKLLTFVSFSALIYKMGVLIISPSGIYMRARHRRKSISWWSSSLKVSILKQVENWNEKYTFLRLRRW